MATSRKRKFVWARTRGTLTPEGDETAQDMLDDFKLRAGGNVLLGATVMVVKGYIRPNNTTSSETVRGVVGVRVCNQGDVEGMGETGQGPAESPEADWMGWFPYLLPVNAVDVDASWNHYGNTWGVDLQSSRKMEELGETVGIFYDFATAPPGGTAQTVVVDYDLSVGLKLP